jgi:hypothetical protein
MVSTPMKILSSLKAKTLLLSLQNIEQQLLQINGAMCTCGVYVHTYIYTYI